MPKLSQYLRPMDQSQFYTYRLKLSVNTFYDCIDVELWSPWGPGRTAHVNIKYWIQDA